MDATNPRPYHIIFSSVDGAGNQDEAFPTRAAAIARAEELQAIANDRPEGNPYLYRYTVFAYGDEQHRTTPYHRPSPSWSAPAIPLAATESPATPPCPPDPTTSPCPQCGQPFPDYFKMASDAPGRAEAYTAYHAHRRACRGQGTLDTPRPVAQLSALAGRAPRRNRECPSGQMALLAECQPGALVAADGSVFQQPTLF